MFWENFCTLCKNVGKSPNAVAKELSLSSGSVTFWKKGKVPHHSTLLKIADFFGVSVDYLLSDTNGKQTSKHSDDITFPTADALSKDESKLLLTYKILTNEGKKKAAEYISDLAGNPNYVSENEIIYLPTAAFDGRFGVGEKVPYTVKELRILLNAEEIDGEEF